MNLVPKKFLKNFDINFLLKKLKGHESHYGSKGLRKIKMERPGRSDINWHFQYAPGSNNGTSVEDGQIPQIIFCAKHPY